MSEARKVLGEFISYEEKEFYGINKYVISYKQPYSTQPDKVWHHQAVEDDLKESAIEKLISLSAGERFCVHQDKDDKGYPVIVDLSDAKDAPERKSGGQAQYNGRKGGGTYDKSGEAVGGAFKYAIDILTNKLKLEDVLALVDKIIPEAEARKKALQAANKAAASAESPSEEKKKSKAELMKEKKAAEAKEKTKKKKEPEPEEELQEQDSDVPDLDEDGLEDVNFDE